MYTDPSLPTMKQMRLEFSLFNSGDPIEWLNKAEQFFELYKVPEKRKVVVASMHLSGKVADIYVVYVSP